MGIFGEAIHGHIGYYKTDIYGAAISEGQLVSAQGLSPQDVNNVILSIASVGPNDSENQILMFDPEGRGVSWSLRIAAQTDSKVSAGYSHIAYWQSGLSAFRDLDTMIYFPFITDLDAFRYLLQNEEQFNPSRWAGCVQNAQNKKSYQMQLLGGNFVLPANLLKKVVCYILSKLDTKARKYLYILVPQGAPYQAYCEAVIWQILSVIPIGLRKGISFATNPQQKDEDNFGIIFQQEANPARHGCDLSFHRNLNHEFLNDFYLKKNLADLIGLFVDDPKMAEICYREMEAPLFGDRLPGSMVPYDSYYGISQLHVNKDRPEYLADCNTLLGQTSGNPQQRKLTENAIRTEIGSAEACLSYIEKDKDYISTKEAGDLNRYLKNRRNLIEYLATIGIDFETLFLYKKLEEICRLKNKYSAEEVYQEIVQMRPNLTEVPDHKKDACCKIAWEKAWNEFEAYIPPYQAVIPLNENGEPSYTPEITEKLLTMRNETSHWSVSDAFEHFIKLTDIAPVNPPVNMILWYRRMRRVRALSELFAIEEAGGIGKTDSQRILNCLDEIFEYSAADGSMKDSQEVGSALQCVQRMFVDARSLVSDGYKAGETEKALVAVHRRCSQMHMVRSEKEDRYPYESALLSQMLLYLRNSSDTIRYKNAINVLKNEIRDISDQYLYRVNEAAAVQLQNQNLADGVKVDIYSAVKEGGLHPQLASMYEDWVRSKFADETVDAGMLEALYASVSDPSLELTEVYKSWKSVDNEKRRIEEMIMTSKTYVRYLKAVLFRRRNANDEQDNQEKRGKFWKQLIHEERDISAFLGAVAYLYDCEPIEFLLSDAEDAETLLNELRHLIGTEGNQMGLLLTEEESLQELYQRVLTYQTLSGNVPKIPLYSLRDFDDQSNLGQTIDAAEKTATAKIFNVTDVLEVLKRLIVIQNRLIAKGEDEQSVAEELNHAVAKDVLGFLDRAGVFDNKSGLDEAFDYIRFKRLRSETEEKTSGIGKFLPYIGWGVAGILLIALIISLLFGRKKDPGDRKTLPTDSTVTESVVSNDSIAESVPATAGAESEQSAENVTVSNPESTVESTVGDTSSTSSVIPADETTAVNVPDQNASSGASFVDGKLISNRAGGGNKKAILTQNEDGYDIDGNGTTDLLPIYNEKSLLGFGFQQNENVQIIPIRDTDTGSLKGYDTNRDGAVDTTLIQVDNNEKTGVDINEDGIDDLGFDFDDDGMCEIGFDF